MQQARVFRAGAFGGDLFGASISIYRDTLVVGAPEDDANLTDAGAVYIFRRSGGTWSQQSKLAAVDKREGHRFGISVSISGYSLAVGGEGSRDTEGNYGGSAYVFAESGTQWDHQIKVVGKNNVFGDRFGASVSVSDTYLAAGAPRVTGEFSGASSGAAYVLRCVTTTTTTTLSGNFPASYYQANTGSNATRAKAMTSSAHARSWSLMPATAFLLLFSGHV